MARFLERKNLSISSLSTVPNLGTPGHQALIKNLETQAAPLHNSVSQSLFVHDNAIN